MQHADLKKAELLDNDEVLVLELAGGFLALGEVCVRNRTSTWLASLVGVELSHFLHLRRVPPAIVRSFDADAVHARLPFGEVLQRQRLLNAFRTCTTQNPTKHAGKHEQSDAVALLLHPLPRNVFDNTQQKALFRPPPAIRWRGVLANEPQTTADFVTLAEVCNHLAWLFLIDDVERFVDTKRTASRALTMTMDTLHELPIYYPNSALHFFSHSPPAGEHLVPRGICKRSGDDASSLACAALDIEHDDFFDIMHPADASSYGLDYPSEEYFDFRRQHATGGERLAALLRQLCFFDEQFAQTLLNRPRADVFVEQHLQQSPYADVLVGHRRFVSSVLQQRLDALRDIVDRCIADHNLSRAAVFFTPDSLHLHGEKFSAFIQFAQGAAALGRYV